MAGRKYQNFYGDTISTGSVGTGDTSFDVNTAPDALGTDEYYIAKLTDSLTSPTKTELIKITGISTNTLTVVRAQEGTTAQSWSSGDIIEIVATASSFENPDNPTFNDYTESTSSAAGTVIKSSGQLIWERTLTANTTFTDGLSNGQSVTQHLYDADTYTPTWPTYTLVGDTALSGLPAACVIVWWKTGGVLYGQYGGVIN
ncbi:hypothetical protein ACFVYJ_01590 [Pontibacter sp. JAM-7]|uniref:hypothetical protein n=1 Tax=Pontibacter sp. JAM-7 TaxID=3366581 RepID=UPI003AF6A040